MKKSLVGGGQMCYYEYRNHYDIEEDQTMGLGDMLLKAGKAVAKDMKQKVELMERYKMQAARYDDDELIRRIKNSSGYQRTGYMMEAKDRGLIRNNE